MALALVAVCASAHADPADDLLAKNLAARGGAEKLRAIKSLRSPAACGLRRRRLLDRGRSGARSRSGPGMIRSEVTLQGLTAVSAYDGKDGWSVEPFGGRRDAEKASADDAERSRRTPTSTARWSTGARRATGRVPRHRGRRRHAGAQAARHAQGRRHRVRLPRSRLVPRDPRRRRCSKVRGAEQITETDLGGYQQVAGVWIPFSIECGAQGRAAHAPHHASSAPRSTSTVDDACFKLPAPGARSARVIDAGPPTRSAPSAAPPPPAPSAGGRRRRHGVRASARATSARRR